MTTIERVKVKAGKFEIDRVCYYCGATIKAGKDVFYLFPYGPVYCCNNHANHKNSKEA